MRWEPGVVLSPQHKNLLKPTRHFADNRLVRFNRRDGP
jgi:hypothetical protein